MKANSFLVELIKKMSVVPDPIIEAKWDDREPLFLSLSREADFRESINDILARAGTPDNVIVEMIRDENTYRELAKCFVPEILDPIHNYERYELFGDQTLNKATFNYLFRVLFPRLQNKETKKCVGYLDNLKQYYVSTKFYSRLALDIGFGEFLHRVCYKRPNILPAIIGRDTKTIDKIYEDIIEAFMGCLELLLDRYVGMHRGYAYVANFVYDLLSDIHINFDPRNYTNNKKTLKETNDRIAANPQLLNHVVVIRQGQVYAESRKEVRDGGNVKTENVTRLNIDSVRFTKDNLSEIEEMMAGKILAYLSALPQYRPLIKAPPSPEELDIQDLVTE